MDVIIEGYPRSAKAHSFLNFKKNMRGDIDIRGKYISSLEEQIDMFRGQHHIYCSQIQKLKDNIRNLEDS